MTKQTFNGQVLNSGRRLVVDGREVTFDEWDNDRWFYYIAEDGDIHVACVDMIDYVYGM